MPHSNPCTGIRLETGVMFPGVTGISLNIPSLSSPQVSICPDVANRLLWVRVLGWVLRSPFSFRIFLLKPIPPFGPNSNLSKYSEQSPQYFVTKPSESPKAHASQPPLSLSEPTITEFSPPNSPKVNLHNLQPNQIKPLLLIILT